MIDFVDDMYEGLQTSLGVGLFHQLFDQFDTAENDALTGAGDVRE